MLFAPYWLSPIPCPNPLPLKTNELPETKSWDTSEILSLTKLSSLSNVFFRPLSLMPMSFERDTGALPDVDLSVKYVLLNFDDPSTILIESFSRIFIPFVPSTPSFMTLSFSETSSIFTPTTVPTSYPRLSRACSISEDVMFASQLS